VSELETGAVPHAHNMRTRGIASKYFTANSVVDGKGIVPQVHMK
jgi:hypothetical protein